MATFTVKSGDGKETLGSFKSMAEAESFMRGEGYSSFSIDDRREGGGRTSGVSIGGGEDALRDIRSGGGDGGIKSIRTNYSGMPFSKAFSSARSTLGPGQTFEWNGKQYSTATAEERPDLAGPRPQAQDAFLSSVPSAQDRYGLSLGDSIFSLPFSLGADSIYASKPAPAPAPVPAPAPTISASGPTTRSGPRGPGGIRPPAPTVTPSGPSIAYGLSDAEVRNMGGGDTGVGRSPTPAPSIDYGLLDALVGNMGGGDSSPLKDYEGVGRDDPRNESGVVAPAPSASQALGLSTAATGEDISSYLAGLSGAQSAVPRAEPFAPSDSEYLSAAYGLEGFPSYGSPEPSPAPYEVATSLADASRAMEVPSTTGGLGDYRMYGDAYEEVKGFSDYMADAQEMYPGDPVKQREMAQYMFDQAAPYNTSRREDAARGEYAASMAMAPQKAPAKRKFSLGDVVNLGTSNAGASTSAPMTELGFDNLPPLSVDEAPLIGLNSPPLKSSSPIAPRPDYRVDYPVFSADFFSSPYLTGLGTLRGTAGRPTRKMYKEVKAQREQSQREDPTISAQGFLTPVVDPNASYASDSMEAARRSMADVLGSGLAPRRSRIRPRLESRWGI